jgi:predicted ATPase/transcriptional regulator with XRE-family HTH domain
MPTFADLLREYRSAARMTQETLAERAQMSVAAIGKLERGARQRPYRATIALLAGALELSPGDRLKLERSAYPESASSENFAPRNNLPVELSRFIGRGGDLENTSAMLALQRLVTLVGAGGVGKTRLAVRTAEHFAAKNGAQLDGVWFVDLSAIDDGESARLAIATSVGLQQGSRTLDMLIEYLRAQQFLLTLDNCEHLLDEAGELAGGILRGCPRARILATSRQALNVDGEHVYRVPPLTMPDAIELFVDRAVAADSRFALTDAIVPTVTQICERLDCIALAIELAAARINAFTVPMIAQHLDEHFLQFTGGGGAALSRHKTMRAVFDWSYQLLTPDEQRAFRRLCVFVEGFTFDTSGVGFEVLDSLIDKSLVAHDLWSNPPRCRLLEPARQYAREKLLEHGEQHDVARAHASTFLALAESFDASLKIIPDVIWDTQVQPESENFRAAIEWALGPDGDRELAQRLCGSTCATLRGRESSELQAWLRAALATCDATTPRDVRAKLELHAAYGALLYEFDEKRTLVQCERALKCQDGSNARTMATAQRYFGHALRQAGRLDEAEAMLRQAHATARSSGGEREYVLALHTLALTLLAGGRLDDARTVSSEALVQMHAGGALRNTASLKVTLAEVEFGAGHVEQALALSKEALAVYQGYTDIVRLSDMLSNVAAYLIAAGRYDEARPYARDALQRARSVGVHRTARWGFQHLAAIALLPSDCAATTRVRGASLFGFVENLDRQAPTLRGHTEQQEYERIICAVGERFDANELARLRAAGAAWSEDHAVIEALAI